MLGWIANAGLAVLVALLSWRLAQGGRRLQLRVMLRDHVTIAAALEITANCITPTVVLKFRKNTAKTCAMQSTAMCAAVYHQKIHARPLFMVQTRLATNEMLAEAMDHPTMFPS